MINKASLDLIKEFEGFRSSAYLDKLADPPVWTIGYGITERAQVGIVPKRGMTVSEEDATKYLDVAVAKFAHNVTRVLKRPANENQFGAMVSLAYNIGPGAFARSTVVRKFNAGDVQGAADAFKMWNKAGGEVWQGLVRRRSAERALFLTPVAHGATLKPAPKPPVQEQPTTPAVAWKPPKAPAIGAAIVALLVAVWAYFTRG